MMNQDTVREGMVVYSADGEKLGKVVAVGPQSFQIEKGFFFPKEYVANFNEVRGVDADKVTLLHGREALRAASSVHGGVTRASESRQAVSDVDAAGELGRSRMERTHDDLVNARNERSVENGDVTIPAMTPPLYQPALRASDDELARRRLDDEAQRSVRRDDEDRGEVVRRSPTDDGAKRY